MNSAVKNKLLASVVVGAAAIAAADASAATLVALSGNDKIIRIDSDTRSVISTTQVEGTERLFSIDVRPENGEVYGLFENGALYVINPVSGERSQPVQLVYTFTDSRYNIDFNPVSDALRIVGIDGENLRVADISTGVVTVDGPITGPETNPFGDEEVNIFAVAYTNNTSDAGGADATQLYDIDRNPEALYLQIPPNNGTLSAVGRINRTLGAFGFDIGVNQSGRNRARIVAGSRLLEIDLGGGVVFSDKPISGLNAAVRDLTSLVEAPL